MLSLRKERERERKSNIAYFSKLLDVKLFAVAYLTVPGCLW